MSLSPAARPGPAMPRRDHGSWVPGSQPECPPICPGRRGAVPGPVPGPLSRRRDDAITLMPAEPCQCSWMNLNLIQKHKFTQAGKSRFAPASGMPVMRTVGPAAPAARPVPGLRPSPAARDRASRLVSGPSQSRLSSDLDDSDDPGSTNVPATRLAPSRPAELFGDSVRVTLSPGPR